MALEVVNDMVSGQQGWDAIFNDNMARLRELYTQGATAKTADYTLVDADNHKHFTNRGAGGTVIFDLPAVTGRGSFKARVSVVANQTVTVRAAAGTIVTKNNAAATSVSASTTNEKIGAVFDIYCDGTSWIVTGISVGHTFTVA